MELISTLIVISFLFVVILLIYLRSLILNIQQKPSKELLTLIETIQNSSSYDKKLLLETLSSSTKDIHDRLDKTTQIISRLYQSVGELSEIGRSIQTVQHYLTSPKLRGGIGEQLLKELLADVLPQDVYSMQYQFSNGKIADAVIKTSAGLIPIDAKFPLDTFRKISTSSSETDQKKWQSQFVKDVKKHIVDISEKYHVYSDNTADYAIMYVPSETIYYEIIKSKTLQKIALEENILIVSPVTFYAYLQAILASMQGQRIQSQAKQILLLIKSVSQDYDSSEKKLSILNKHLSNAYSAASVFTSDFGKIKTKLTSTSIYQLPENKQEDKK